jgi:hypothetical protein
VLDTFAVKDKYGADVDLDIPLDQVPDRIVVLGVSTYRGQKKKESSGGGQYFFLVPKILVLDLLLFGVF